MTQQNELKEWVFNALDVGVMSYPDLPYREPEDVTSQLNTTFDYLTHEPIDAIQNYVILWQEKNQ